uniref:Calmodulin n=1 Tax=Alexandrium catenella TaxID=2925 RepID=A0A7S1ME47_ALECA|mmetsp:Transcript_24992/g.68285  ORF Transcript_24992/g.68285 Transcript_24992/m.68285 type:complete len:415 (+) Transcript_24992:3-1247(+)
MISVPELRQVLIQMGYTPLTENVNEVLEDVDTGRDNVLDFHDFFDFVFIYRQREGFRRDEVQEMRRLFERFDADDSGEISAMELKELFRHMGYRVTMDQVHLFVAQVDENNSNCLDFREYLKLMQLHREAELRSITGIFNSLKDRVTGMLTSSNVDKAFKGLQQEPPKALPKLASKGFNFDGFVKLVDSCRADLVARERKKAGFTDERIAELQEVFSRFDKDGSGEIDNIELMSILTEFGWNPKTQEEQKELMTKIQMAKDAAKEADPDHDLADDGIKFWSYVQLARMLETEHEQAEEELMNRLMKELNFNQKEVDDFRQIYMNKKHEIAEDIKERTGKDPDGLPRDDVRRLVRSLGISLIGENKVKLDTELKRLGCDDLKPLDFPGFLQLMRWIMTADMATAVTQASPDGQKK